MDRHPTLLAEELLDGRGAHHVITNGPIQPAALERLTASPATVIGHLPRRQVTPTPSLSPGATLTFTGQGKVHVATGKYVVTAAGAVAATDPQLRNIGPRHPQS